MAVVNFPAQPTPFIGRVQELAQITALLADDSCRLLTLVGPGGIGKTRLAIEAALVQPGRYADGVYFVALQPLTSTELILPAIAQALNVQFSPNCEPRQQLLDILRDKMMLLVLDNIEHVLDGVELLSEILTVAPGVRILTTSRERLNLVEEWVFDVGGLDVPNGAPLAEARHYSAIELFERGAQRVDRSFSVTNDWEHVVRICRLVDGMPLALELASAWVRALPLEEIAAELEHSLDILETASRNVLPRHRNMRAVLNYSWTLLTDSERQTFTQLAVFRGGFTRDAAETIAGASRHTLAGLVDKSWLRYSSESSRYDIHELLRQFAQECLDACDGAAWQTHERHCRYYMALVRGIWLHLGGAQFAEASAEIETELENIRSGWGWAVHNHQFDALEGTLQSLWFFYDRGSRFQEGETVFAKAAAQLAVAGEAYRPLYGNVLARQGAMLFSLDRYIDALPLLEQSVEVLRAYPPGEALAFALLALGETIAEEKNDIVLAETLFHESLAIYRSLNDLWGVAYTLNWLNICRMLDVPEDDPAHARFSVEQAFAYVRESLDIFEELNNTWGIALANASLASLFWDKEDYATAWEMANQALALFTESDVAWGRAFALHMMADLAALQGKSEQARRHICDGLRIVGRYQLIKYGLFLLYRLAELEHAAGREEVAYELLAFIESLRVRFTYPAYADFSGLDRLKTATIPELRAAIERGRGQAFSPFVQQMIAYLEATAPGDAPVVPSASPLTDPLTERELDVLRLLADGRSNRQIAAALVVALGTVKTHIHNLCGKLNAGNRTEAVARARQIGLL
jgi:predicted ATPase/DNA-binding CsgD family transcriptional regulator